MNYMDVKTAASKWKLTERRVTTLCRDGRIGGGKKEGGIWLIPENAEKPQDGRSNRFSKSAGMVTKLPLPIKAGVLKKFIERPFK